MVKFTHKNFHALWRLSIFSISLIAALIIILSSAHAQDFGAATDSETAKKETGIDPTKLGRLFTKSIRINGFNVPLPDGYWVIMVQGTLKGSHSNGVTYLLGKIIHKRLVQELIVEATRADSGQKHDPITVPKTDYFFEAPECSIESTGSCWTIYGLSTALWDRWEDSNIKMDPVTRAAGKYMSELGISYPTNMVVVSFVRREDWGMLDIAYHFDPGASDVSAHANYDNLKPQPSNMHYMSFKSDYVEKMKNWAAAYWPRIKATFATGE